MIDVRCNKENELKMARIFAKAYPDWSASDVARSVSDLVLLGWGPNKLMIRLDEMRLAGRL